MHGSTAASLRPRQRTSTSCTECRRRKQKCNQAKDRPCNNCARRYPPVACTYDGGRSSSRGSTVERVVDLQGEESRREDDHFSGRTVDHPSYGQGHVAESDYPAATSNQYASNSYYPPGQASTGYWPQQDQSWNANYATTTAGTYDGSYYGSAGTSTAGANYDSGYYSTYSGYTPQWLAMTGDPRAFVGTGTTYDNLNDLPIEPSRRNAELYHFFHQSLAPYLVTIDSKDPPDSFYKEWTPWIIQSSLLATVPLLNASCFLSDAKGLEIVQSPEIIALRSRTLSVINEYLRRKKLKEVEIEAVAAVFYLAMNEWYWGDDGNFWAHLKGLKEIIRLRGGFDSMEPNSLLRKQLILADYQIAVSFEHELFLHEDHSRGTTLIELTSYSTFLESPLLPSGIRFLDIFDTFSLTIDIAEMLDDMKFLTASIRTFQTSPNAPSAEDLAKFRSSAQWTYNRILSLPSQLPSADPLSDMIYESIRTTALIYSTSILSLSPLSKSHTPGQINEVHDKMWKVSLSRWKQMPGILLWIILVVAAAGGENEKQAKKFAERIIHSVAMFIGVQSQEVAINLMRAFLGVQRWVGGRDERAFEGSGKGKARVSGDLALDETIQKYEEAQDDGEGGVRGVLGGLEEVLTTSRGLDTTAGTGLPRTRTPDYDL